MALKHHPDKNPNNPEATEKVSLVIKYKGTILFGVANCLCLCKYVCCSFFYKPVRSGVAILWLGHWISIWLC